MAEIIEQENSHMETLNTVAAEFPACMNSLYADFLREIFLEYPGLEKVVRSHRDEMTARLTQEPLFTFIVHRRHGFVKTSLQDFFTGTLPAKAIPAAPARRNRPLHPAP
ncbi:MAG: hypothetical protein VB099_12040 [Candidatus Limiplasma sp.]|nr:hypothetical protein [Candidatus Limiplasma sp.]